MGRNSKVGVTFRMGRRMHFSSALIDEAHLKAGDCFAVTIVTGKEPFIRLTSTNKQSTTDYYVFLANMAVGCTSKGNQLVGITDRNLSMQLDLTQHTVNRPARWHRKDGKVVIEFTFPKKEAHESAPVR